MADNAPSAGTARRRRLVIIGAVVAIVVLIGVPAYLAAQPDFFSDSESLASKYEPWSSSTHAEVGCEDCHTSPSVLSQVAYRLSSAGWFYASLVGQEPAPDDFEVPTNEACLECHSDMPSVSPSGDLQIPHKAHVEILKMDCVQCHNVLVHETNLRGNHIPPMEGCLECHDGDTAKDTCTACHTEKGAPESHAADDWLIVHGQAAEDPKCDSCHEWTENWCVDCHATRPASHVDEWRALHGDAVAQRRNCEACHEGAFCDRCHGEVPQLNYDPTLELVQ